MAAPGTAAISVSLEGYSGSGKVATPTLLGAMLRAADQISDLVFSPGRPPQVQVQGQLAPLETLTRQYDIVFVVFCEQNFRRPATGKVTVHHALSVPSDNVK